MNVHEPIVNKVAIYVRISSQLQHTDRQREELIAIAKKKNYEIVEIYSDIMSGFKDNEYRQGLQKLLEDSKQGKFEAILFSEFSRLSRKVNDLGTMIDTFRNQNTKLYFQKQNLWVMEKGEMMTDMFIYMLGVVSSYEIELFADRSISGKISAIKSRGINLGGLTAYGYESEPNTKRLIINNFEASIVKRLFSLYSTGYSQQKICEVLKSENVPSPYKKRLVDSATKRVNNGIKPKEYKNFDTESLVWTASSINKILKNRLYLGERNAKIHKPDPTNPTEISKRKNREIIEVINIKDELIRIIDDTLFNEVQDKLKENSLVKNTPTKHPTLLKSVLKCGCCGRNVVSTKANGSYRYMCFGRIKDTKTRVINCKESKEIAQYKLDGLVVQMILFRIADADRTKKSTKRIEELTTKKEISTRVLLNKESELKIETEAWLKYFEKSVRFDIPEDALQNRKDEFDSKSQKLNQDINKIKNELHDADKTIKSIQVLSSSETLKQQEETIRENKTLLKQLTDEYLDKITIYPIFDKYSLVIINFIDGSESWGTIKSAKYKNDEMWFDPTLCKEQHYIYQLFNNDDKSAEYIPDNKTVVFKGKTYTSCYNTNPIENKPRFETIPREGQNPIIRMIESKTSNDESNYVEVTTPDPYITIKAGTYPIKEFITLLKEDNENGHNSNGSFPPYDFHEDEEGNDLSKEKAKQYRLDNADKRNARTKELRHTKRKI
jgi:DNA invertase Pin-like site-specific DNA recombinase